VRRVSLLLLVAACSRPVASTPAAPAASSPPQGFSISVHPPRVGETRRDHLHTTQKTTLSRGSEQSPPRVVDETYAFDDTVDAVAGLAVTGVTAVVTVAVTDSSTAPSSAKLHVVVRMEDGKVVVRDSTGAQPGEPYARDLADHYRVLGRPESFLVHVPATPLRTGDHVPEYEDALRERFARHGPDGEGRMMEVHVEVGQVDPAHAEATLIWKGRIVGRQLGFELDGTLEGSLRVRGDGRLSHFFCLVNGKGRTANGVEVAIESSEEHDFTYDEATK
jgi:hypothetical protein